MSIKLFNFYIWLIIKYVNFLKIMIVILNKKEILKKFNLDNFDSEMIIFFFFLVVDVDILVL